MVAKVEIIFNCQKLITFGFMIKISILGNGNVAFHLYQAFADINEIEIVQVYSRNKTNLFPNHLLIHHFSDLIEADIFIIAVSDDAIEELSNKIPFENKLIVHTAGSISLKKINSKNSRGVFYPLQTFSKDKSIDFCNIPICIEAENEKDATVLVKLANYISENVHVISEKQREKLHLSAVFVCNFVNHLYHIGALICESNSLPFDILQPLIQETSDKILHLHPSQAQTGPAIRNDQKTINLHLSQLISNDHQNIYKLLTYSIQNVNKL